MPGKITSPSGSEHSDEEPLQGGPGAVARLDPPHPLIPSAIRVSTTAVAMVRFVRIPPGRASHAGERNDLALSDGIGQSLMVEFVLVGIDG